MSFLVPQAAAKGAQWWQRSWLWGEPVSWITTDSFGARGRRVV